MEKKKKKVRNHHKMVNIKGETNGGLSFWSKEERGIVQAKEVGGEGRDFVFTSLLGHRNNLRFIVVMAEEERRTSKVR